MRNDWTKAPFPPADPERLRFWPGRGNIPYRGAFGLRGKDEPTGAATAYTAHVEIFDLSDSDQKAKFERVCGIVATGLGFWVDRDIQHEGGTWKVLAHWVEVTKEPKEAVQQRKLQLLRQP